MQVVGELGVALVDEDLVELVARQRAGDPHRVLAGALDVVAVAPRLVGPAHVARELAAGDHVVGDDRLGRHVAEVGVAEVHAVAHERAHVAHVEPVDQVGPELVDHDDQHPLGLLRLPVARGWRRRAQQDQQANHHDRQATHGSLPPVDESDSLRAGLTLPTAGHPCCGDATGSGGLGACRAGGGASGGCRGRARAPGHGGRVRHGLVRDDDGARPGRTHLRRRAGGPAARDQEQHAARDPVRHRAGDLDRRARAARRHLRPELREQPLRLRLLHGREPGGEPRRALHGQRVEPRRGRGGQRAGDHRQHPVAVRLPQRRVAALRARRQAVHRGRREPHVEQRAEHQLAHRQAAAAQLRRLGPGRQPVRQPGLVARAAEPVHVRHRAGDRPHLHQRRRRGQLRGDQRDVDHASPARTSAGRPPRARPRTRASGRRSTTTRTRPASARSPAARSTTRRA